jgi:hypothetical protein
VIISRQVKCPFLLLAKRTIWFSELLPATLSQKLRPQGFKADYSSFLNSEVKNEWRYTPAAPYF